MIIIADTTPLNYLCIIGEQDILHKLFGQIIIPQAVYDELQADETPASVKTWIESHPAWLEIKTVTLTPDMELLELDAGEREAILLAMELNADALIMDDRSARDEANKRNLPVVGTLGVLERAAELGRVDFPQALTQLKQTSFYISESLEKSFLARDAERKQNQSTKLTNEETE
jgi:predicted nucleic acid-binding protein